MAADPSVLAPPRRLAARLPIAAARASLALAGLYGLGFVGNLIVPRTLDSAAWWVLGPPLAIDLALIGAVLTCAHRFSLLADGSSRAAVLRTAALTAALAALFALWQPMHGLVWHMRQPEMALLAEAAFATGAGLTLVGAMRPLLQGRSPCDGPSRRWPFRLGPLLMLWATPTMSTGHLLFSTAASLGLWWLRPGRADHRD